MFVLIDKNNMRAICCSDNETKLQDLRSELEYYTLFYSESEYEQIKDPIILKFLEMCSINSYCNLFIDEVVFLDNLTENVK